MNQTKYISFHTINHWGNLIDVGVSGAHLEGGGEWGGG